ncbi:Ent-kaurene oxidase [Colletotrichum higginsianum IMI 349063]|nr:Ent-kaurene oxidase [Colletotrichum higginsianum IMI 349063]OBR13040.1 Ent-kaurene oxidase [Colletotrichum higginsianum IMI 349063]
MGLELPQSAKWNEVNINAKLLCIIAMTSGRAFVSPELCRDEIHLDASINFTKNLIIAVYVYWLAARTEPVTLLLEDVQQALTYIEGQFTSTLLQNMKKLDSFIREIKIVIPLSANFYLRKVVKLFQLPNGQTIPEGMFIEVPSIGINEDPEIFPIPDVFDALRFDKLREDKDQLVEVVSQAQSESVGTTHLTFSYGKHACPGRDFTVNEIKMIVANLFCHYDIKSPDGVNGRYQNLALATR